MIYSRTTGLLLVSLVLGTLFCSACASKQDVSSLKGRVSHQQQQQARENQELKKQIVTLESELQKAREDLKEEISATSGPVRSKQANLWAEIENLRVQLATARGKIDGLDRKIRRMENTQANATRTLEELSTKTARTGNAVTTIAGQLGMDPNDLGQGGVSSPRKTPSEQKQASSQPVAAPSYDSAQELYKKALNSFYAKQYDQALSLWEEFVAAFKTNKLVPNALFWQGECHYQMRDYARAILAYQKVIEKYKKSNKYRPALLKQGISFYKMDKKKPGKLVLTDLIKHHPQSAEARRAKAFLKTK